MADKLFKEAIDTQIVDIWRLHRHRDKITLAMLAQAYGQLAGMQRQRWRKVLRRRLIRQQ